MTYEFYEKAIEILQRKTTIPGDGYTWEDINEAIELAIESIKLRIPTKVIPKKWNPNTCPFCLTDLGGDCYDGYYENPSDAQSWHTRGRTCPFPKAPLRRFHKTTRQSPCNAAVTDTKTAGCP